MTADKKSLWECVDTLENLSYSICMPVPDSLHAKAMREALPELVKEMKAAYVEEVGENPREE